MTDKKIRWGIVSTADIGMKKVIPGIMKSLFRGRGAGLARSRPCRGSAAPTRPAQRPCSRLLRGAVRRCRGRCHLQSPPRITSTSPSRSPPPWRQARALRKAHLDHRSGGRGIAPRARRRADCRGLHGPPSPAMAPRARHRPLGRARPCAAGARRLSLFPTTPQTSATSPTSAAAACSISAATASSPAAICSRPSRCASSPWSTATRPSVPIGSPASSPISPTAGS